MPRLDDSFDDLARALHAHYGPTPPPAFAAVEPATPWFERIAEVALRLVASPKVAAAALAALRAAGLLDPRALAAANPLAIDDVLKGARVAMALKSLRPLQKLARWAAERAAPDDGEIAAHGTESLRDDWRAINGVGPALADALLLLALGRPTFPVDRAAFRILVRHNWLEAEADYDEARSVVERHAGRSDLAAPGPTAPAGFDPDSAEARLLADLRAWLAEVGRDFCKPGQPRCDRCPLRPWLPPDGPVVVE